jgi:dihydrofolate reductase
MGMRKIIAALQISVDGFVEGPNGELDWVTKDDENIWPEVFATLANVDTLVLGRVTYLGFEQYWLSVLANPNGALPFSGKRPTEAEIKYARWADHANRIVVSRTLDKVEWQGTQILRDLDAIRRLKDELGQDIHVVGGATLVSALMNAGLIDEIGLLVNPIVLGGGKALFKDVKDRHGLKLLAARPLNSGMVKLSYSTQG